MGPCSFSLPSLREVGAETARGVEQRGVNPVVIAERLSMALLSHPHGNRLTCAHLAAASLASARANAQDHYQLEMLKRLTPKCGDFATRRADALLHVSPALRHTITGAWPSP